MKYVFEFIVTVENKTKCRLLILNNAWLYDEIIRSVKVFQYGANEIHFLLHRLSRLK